MNKNLLAFVAALAITTAPICAETETSSTYQDSAVTTSNDETTSETTAPAETSCLPTLTREEAGLLKIGGALYATLGAGLLALSYNHYQATMAFPVDIHVVGQQYDAFAGCFLGTFATAVGALMYFVGSKAPQYNF